MVKCAIPECENEAQWSGKGRKSLYCSEACKQKAKRVRANQKRVARLRESRSKLYVLPCTLDIANAFVKLHHRHNKEVPGAKFTLAVVDETGLMRGVAIVGRPVARNLDNGACLEVNRVCTDGCPNACSILYAAARKVAFDLGYQRLITYTLVDETGASMRGAGWAKVSETQAHTGRGWHTRALRKEQSVYQVSKWRWETINPAYRDKARPTKVLFPEVMKPDNGQLDLFEGAMN